MFLLSSLAFGAVPSVVWEKWFPLLVICCTMEGVIQIYRTSIMFYYELTNSQTCLFRERSCQHTYRLAFSGSGHVNRLACSENSRVKEDILLYHFSHCGCVQSQFDHGAQP